MSILEFVWNVEDSNESIVWIVVNLDFDLLADSLPVFEALSGSEL